MYIDVSSPTMCFGDVQNHQLLGHLTNPCDLHQEDQDFGLRNVQWDGPTKSWTAPEKNEKAGVLSSKRSEI